MIARRSAVDIATFSTGFALFVMTVLAWRMLLREQGMMVMSGPGFVAQWSVMMAAMMLPSAAPMILLYQTVSRRLRDTHAVAGVSAFAAVYLLVWMLIGIPVYFAYVGVTSAAAHSHAFANARPFLIGNVLVIAGVYQLSSMKGVCLRHCEMPVSFLMRRWRAGYTNTLRIALAHSAYCFGCCWALMLILVAAGAMSLPWVLGITTLVFMEKVLPGGRVTARLIGFALILSGIAVAVTHR